MNCNILTEPLSNVEIEMQLQKTGQIKAIINIPKNGLEENWCDWDWLHTFAFDIIIGDNPGGNGNDAIMVDKVMPIEEQDKDGENIICEVTIRPRLTNSPI